jgi:glycosyltransferase involved in cell wall biosynthesis
MGSGDDTRALVRELGLGHRTVFTGLLHAQQRLEALADSDVIVYPSQHEIFGLVPLEALMAGTSVIVADDSGCGEIIAAIGGGQIVPVGHAGALARAIERVLAEPSAWRAAAADAAARVKATFGEDVVCSQVDELYREMLAERRAVA